MQPLNLKLGSVVAIFYITACVFILPNIDDIILRLVVAFYVSILLIMWWRAVSRLLLLKKNEKSFTWPKLCCALGASSYLISDSVLSFDVFIQKIPYR